ncbi:hypothetical protein A5697_26730 [Mycobacterium sp. E3251]|uniref:hypothetical protein n=1 Tax=unclassified Mycobacterium TaxID=2642494 RepID=UPI0007FD9DCA|nr:MULTISPECIES: hypothetical protein [unclassified Mycobacterium]OBG94265.1 hypothetical protein A5697_26730 [Mycobacterium sp. E3251]OBI26055.1 hypothetical protein A5709_07770 [Mycobacterium sp. E1386]OBI29254.1 hypothetical protein A5711_25050 [Mycobacterium sp. E2238]
MATPHSPGKPAAGASETAKTNSPVVDYDDEAPRVIRVRLAPWDVVSTIALLAVLVILATATTWPDRLFGFLEHVCADETCGPVPFGIDYYIRPVVWGGIGAAIAAAVVGPLVSMLKGWYMSFWPVLALTLVMVSSVVGSLLTTFSERYWL